MEIASNIHDPLIRAVVHDFLKRFVPQGQIAWIVGASEDFATIGETAKAQKVIATIARADLPSIGIQDIGGGRLILVDRALGHRPNFASCCKTLAQIFGLAETELVFVNAYRTRSDLANCALPPWGTVAWFADEPDHYIDFNGGRFWPRRQPRALDRLATRVE